MFPGTEAGARAKVRNNRISVTEPFEEDADLVAGIAVFAADYVPGGDFHDSEITDGDHGQRAMAHKFERHHSVGRHLHGGAKHDEQPRCAQQVAR